MNETWYAGAYWLGRKESAEACARRAETFFRSMGRCDPSWSTWCEAAESFEASRLLPFEPDAANLARMFGRRENQEPGDGVSLWAWAGSRRDEVTGVSLRCGSASHQTSAVCLLKPPSYGPVAERVVSAGVMKQVLRNMAVAWEPEWAVATSDNHRDMVSGRARAGTFVGWMMYFSRRRGEVPPLPKPVQVEPVEGLGTLVVLTPDRFSAANPEHVELAAQVREALRCAKLLGALRPWKPVGYPGR